MHTPFVIHQPRYNMFNRQIESDLFPVLKREHKAAVGFSSLCQGLLTDKYLNGIPDNSRAAKSTSPFLQPKQVKQTLKTVRALNEVAESRGQTLAEMALAWNLRDPELACVLVGASRPEQLLDNVKALNHLDFTADELAEIDNILNDQSAIDWSR